MDMLTFAYLVVVAGPWLAGFATLLALLHSFRSRWAIARMAFGVALLALCLGGVGAGILTSNVSMLTGMVAGSLVVAAVLVFEYRRFDPQAKLRGGQAQ